MERLKYRLKALGINYETIAAKAGKKERNFSQYLSNRRDIGPGPKWVEEALTNVLREAGVSVVEAAELVGEWKEARIRLVNGSENMATATETDEGLTLEERIANLVKSCWPLCVEIEMDKKALIASAEGCGVMDDTTRERTARKILDDELATEAVGRLTQELWARREGEHRAEVKKVQADLDGMDEKIKALEVAMAGVGPEEPLKECKELGVDPADRLRVLKETAVPDATKKRDGAKKALKELPSQPLHPSRSKFTALSFSKDIEEAAAILSAPWTVVDTMPELTLLLFQLRRQIAPIPDMAEHLKKTIRPERFWEGSRPDFQAGLFIPTGVKAQPGPGGAVLGAHLRSYGICACFQIRSGRQGQSEPSIVSLFVLEGPAPGSAWDPA